MGEVFIIHHLRTGRGAGRRKDGADTGGGPSAPVGGGRFPGPTRRVSSIQSRKWLFASGSLRASAFGGIGTLLICM